MKNNIDKDITLFSPEKFNFLLLGGNFLFSKRLYEIMKRQFKIKRIDYKHNNNVEYFSCIDNYNAKIHTEPYEKIQSLINLHNSDTLIFTSEVLLFLSNDDYVHFFNTLKEIKKMNIKLVFISINNPLHICKKENGLIEISNMHSKDWYHNRLHEIDKLLDVDRDLIYNFSSYCTYVTTNLQTNLIELINNKESFDVCHCEEHNKFSMCIADYVIDDIILNVKNKGKLLFDEKNSEIITLLEIHKNFYKGNLYDYINSQVKCSLNLIYRKKPFEISNGKSVADWRFKLGYSLKENVPKHIIDELDYIVPIPETGKYYAQGLSYALNIPYLEAFYKQSEVGRSFDISDTEKREKFINSKLGLIDDIIKNKSIGIVDEAIFTGQTLKIVRSLLNQTDVKNIYFFIASPMCKNKCIYNMQPDRELLCENKNVNQLISYFDINDIFFQNINSFEKIIKQAGFDHICCFSK